METKVEKIEPRTFAEAVKAAKELKNDGYTTKLEETRKGFVLKYYK